MLADVELLRELLVAEGADKDGAEQVGVGIVAVQLLLAGAGMVARLAGDHRLRPRLLLSGVGRGLRIDGLEGGRQSRAGQHGSQIPNARDWADPLLNM